LGAPDRFDKNRSLHFGSSQIGARPSKEVRQFGTKLRRHENFLFLNKYLLEEVGCTGARARAGEGSMFNVRAALAAVVLALPAAWAIASIVADARMELVSQASPAQVDTFTLMSRSPALPVQKYDGY
jgi:hypothetical protein